MEVKHKKGTTTLGIVCKDGVVLAADRRATLGHLSMHSLDKIFPITKNIAITTAGSVADAQLLVKYMVAEMKLFTLDSETEPSIDVAASMLSTILFNGKGYFPFYVALLLGGKDSSGGYKLYSLMGDGSSISDTYTVTGSGMELALGTLETGFKPGMTINDAVELATQAIRIAAKRDVNSGEGVDVVIIDQSGFKRLATKSVTLGKK